MSRRSSRNSVFVKKDYPICRVVENIKGDLDFVSPMVNSTNIDDIIQEDKKYGVFKPANGKYFTYQVLNEDEEISKKDASKIIRYSFLRATRRLNIKFKRAKAGEVVDFKLEFRTVDTDPDKQLTDNTLMYHYYPISDINHPLRGLCVVNKAFYWTSHGKRLPYSVIDPDTEHGTATIRTYDFDQIYTHEAVGHGLGLPHAKTAGHIMSSNAGIMAEWLSDQDVARLEAKYPKRVMSERRLNRWLKWLFHASNR